MGEMVSLVCTPLEFQDKYHSGSPLLGWNCGGKNEDLSQGKDLVIGSRGIMGRVCGADFWAGSWIMRKKTYVSPGD